MKKYSIYNQFPIGEAEYAALDKSFGNLCHFAAWQLLRKNVKNNHTDEFDDINQSLRESLLQAGCYQKRQAYIQKCLAVTRTYISDRLVAAIWNELSDLWVNKTRHGANRQKFGPYQEGLLEVLVKKVVPKKKRPDRQAVLVIDDYFVAYCKTTLWNKQKTMGKRITREKGIRSGLTSLSEFDFLGAEV